MLNKISTVKPKDIFPTRNREGSHRISVEKYLMKGEILQTRC